MHTTDIENIFEILASTNPKPVTELAFASPFECLIAVLLSAQSTDIQVNKVTKKLYAKANTPEHILALGETELINHIKHIGLFRNKAKHIMATCQILVDQYQGNIPTTREELEALPGVGRKTANVVLNVAYGKPTMAVDTHVFRVSHRIGLVKNKKTPLKTELALLKCIPKRFLYDAHHWLILHGRYICKARKPLCGQCPIAHLCQCKQKTDLTG